MALSNDRDKVAHLLRRFGLGASESELDYYAEGGVASAIDKLLGYESVVEPDLSLERFANDNGQVNMRALQAWFHTRVLTTKRPLETAMTLFWHNHFATSAEKVDAVGAMHDHVECLRAHCTGNFRELLTAVSKDPAMLYWLDNHENKKGKPNENFAREVMELFTLGIGHYSESDVQEAARAFTGWTYGNRRPNGRVIEPPKPAQRPKYSGPGQPRIGFVFREEQHDSGEKSILGNRGVFDGDDVLGILTGHPRTALFVTEKFLTWFATPKPEPKYVERMAKAFRDSGMEIKALCRAVMESPEFYSDRAVRTIVKNPVHFCVSTLRQLGLGQRIEQLLADEQAKGLRAGGISILVQSATKSMGMDLLYPPDVAGWKIGDSWISTATMVERMKWADKLFGSFVAGKKAGGQQRTLNYPVVGLVGPGADPRSVAERLVSVFDTNLPEAKVKQLAKAAEDTAGGPVTAANANAVAHAVARLIFSSPEFQFC